MRILVKVGAGILAAVATLAALFASNSFRDCLAVGGHESVGVIFSHPLRFLRCSLGFFDHHAGGIGAIGGLLVAGFTFTLWRTTSDTLGHLRREFIAAHPPRVRVRSFKRLDHSSDKSAIQFTVINTGGSNARVTASNVSVGVSNSKNVVELKYSDGADSVAHEMLETGTPLVIVVPEGTANTYARQVQGYLVLHVFGYVRYADEVGKMRTTAFCRYWDDAQKRFSPSQDRDRNSEYEYED